MEEIELQKGLVEWVEIIESLKNTKALQRICVSLYLRDRREYLELGGEVDNYDERISFSTIGLNYIDLVDSKNGKDEQFIRGGRFNGRRGGLAPRGYSGLRSVGIKGMGLTRRIGPGKLI